MSDHGYHLFNLGGKYVNRRRGCQFASAADLARRYWGRLPDCLLPPCCILCGSSVSTVCLCRACRADLPWSGRHCRRCGLPLANTADAVCGRCLRKPPPFDRTLCPLEYRFPVDRLIQAFKFRRQHAAGRVLAHLLHDWIVDQAVTLPDALIPVPLHPLRFYTRGFNQAWELAGYIGRQLDIPVLATRLRRRRRTAAQAGLNRKQRRKNVRGAFYWHGWNRAPTHVALIDDVITTGTTAAECARVLRRAGARRVDVWAAARTAARAGTNR